MPARRSKICCGCRAKPGAKQPKQVLTEAEKEGAKIKREANKIYKEHRREWEATLPKAWVEGVTPFRHPCGTHVMFKSDSKKAFNLTEAEILTLPHESVPGPPKTYFALAAARDLQQRKFAAGSLLASGVKGDLRVLKATNDIGRRREANFWCFHVGDEGSYERWYGTNRRITAKVSS
ncbi:hypothetical protein B0H19DRAFT_1079328 [Mycena capillaripes]|nr:hypothetical protein B0H19DRAFT_1079328 [Mycena capillaripes]